jgi:ribosomal protein L24
MAIKLDYTIGTEKHTNAYMRIEHIQGSKTGGWSAVVYVYDKERIIILDTINVTAEFNTTHRGYETIYVILMQEYPESIAV